MLREMEPTQSFDAFRERFPNKVYSSLEEQILREGIFRNNLALVNNQNTLFLQGSSQDEAASVFMKFVLMLSSSIDWNWLGIML